jgi:hypothetical protein
VISGPLPRSASAASRRAWRVLIACAYTHSSTTTDEVCGPPSLLSRRTWTCFRATQRWFGEQTGSHVLLVSRTSGASAWTCTAVTGVHSLRPVAK